MVKLKVINTKLFVPSGTGNALPIGIVSAELSARGPSSKPDRKIQDTSGAGDGPPRCQSTGLDSGVSGQRQKVHQAMISVEPSSCICLPRLGLI